MRHARHDAVAPHEVALVGVGARGVFREQCAASFNHLPCRVAVHRRIDAVEAVGQHADGVCAAVHGRAVRHDVHAVGEAAHNQHVRHEAFQFGAKLAAHQSPVFRDMARAHYRHDVLPVQIGVAFLVEQGRGVGAVAQQKGEIRVVERQDANGMAFAEIQFALRLFHGGVLARSQCLGERRVLPAEVGKSLFGGSIYVVNLTHVLLCQTFKQ